MARIGGKNTGPEVKLRRSLHRLGLRYRLHDKRLPGKPDLVFRRFKAVVFVHGCFWHRHDCKLASMPRSNRAYWRKKFAANTKRDARHQAALEADGWRVAIVWECALQGKGEAAADIAEQVRLWLHNFSSRYLVLDLSNR